MPDLLLPWGPDELTVSAPRHWRLQQVAGANLRPAGEDWPDRLGRALSQPTGDAPLAGLLAARRHGRVVLVVEDITRQSPLAEILPVVLREIRHAGLADEQIEIFFATGMHPPMTPEQVAGRLAGSCPDIPWRCNEWDNSKAHVFLGEASGVPVFVDRKVAQADLRIIISSVSPHLQAGFGGGYKMIFPGCAHLATIRALHRRGVGRGARQLVGSDAAVNPMRRVIDEAGAMLDQHHGRSFAVQYLLDQANLPSFIAAGEVMVTHQMMAKQCAVACGVVVGEPADVLIVNAHPRDIDLWQSFKCIANTLWAARPNGAIICLSRCEEGLHGMKVPRWPINPLWTRRLVRWLGPDGLSSLVMRLIPSLAGDAAFFVRMAAQAIHRNPIYMVSPALHAAGVRFPGLHLFGGPAEAIAAVDAYLGAGPKRVVAFPAGGTTFPAPRGPADAGLK